MNPQERALLEQFLDALVAVKNVKKIPEAEELIQEALALQPDAPYLLVQRCLLLDRGLAQAKARIAALEESQAPTRSFLEGGYETPPFSRSPAPGAISASPATAAPLSGPAGGGGAGGFLGQAAATAAGVAGGAFLFEGLERLFDRHDPGLDSEGFSRGPAEEVINNYYESDDGGRVDSASEDEPQVDDDGDNFI
jgi:hypothetical protein